MTILLYNLLSAIPVKAADDIVYYHLDALGTPVALTNSQGNVVWTGSSLPFGEEFSGSGTRDTEIKYAGIDLFSENLIS